MYYNNNKKVQTYIYIKSQFQYKQDTRETQFMNESLKTRRILVLVVTRLALCSPLFDGLSDVFMHQSVVTTAPAPGNSGDFDFLSSKTQLPKTQHCGDSQLVKPPPCSPAVCVFITLHFYFAYITQIPGISPSLQG